MAIKIIMGITNIILILSFYYVTSPAVDKRHNRYFGVSIDISTNSEISKLVEKYKLSNKKILYLFLFLVLISFFYTSSTYILLTHIIVFIGGLIGFYQNMIKYTMKFDDLILNNDEIISNIEIRKTRKVDLYLSSRADDYKFTNLAYNLFFPLAICIYMLFKVINISNPSSIEYSIKFLYIVMLSINVVFLIASIFATRYVKNIRQIQFTENTEENIVINFNRKNSAINAIYLINNINIIGNFIFALMFIKSVSLSIAVLILVSVFTLFLILYIYKKMKNNSYMEEDTLGSWVYGIFYYNKANTKLMVPQRFGVGTTINMARPMGKLIGISSVCLVIFLYSYMTYTIIGNDIVDSKLVISNDVVHISSLDYSKSVDFSEIKSIELISSYEIDILLKTNGIGTEKYSRGYYNVKNFGNCFLCIYKSSNLFILIKSEKGNIFYSEKTSKETEQVYNTLNYRKFQNR